MYQIALLDDETEELNKTIQILDRYESVHTENSFEVECFESAEKFLRQVTDEQYAPDLIIMDIYMPDKMGIDVAKELRSMGNKCRIIFLTTSKEHALDAFEVEATQYLLKPISAERLCPVLDRIMEEDEEARRKYLLLRIENRIRRVAVSDIAYCEAQGKMQYLQLTDGSNCVLRATLTEIYEQLVQYHEFVRVGIGYIVNLEHIESLCRQELKMDNGKVLYLPRGSYGPLREKYFAYYCEEEN